MTRAFVIGNIAIDETYRVDELPREGASIHGVRVARDLGGKGANQAIILARAGVETALVAGVGIDSRGEAIRRLVADEPIDSRLVELRHHASDVSMVFTTPPGANAIVTTNDCARTLSPADIAARIGDTSFGDWAVLQGNLTYETTRAAMDMALSRGLKIVFNPSPVDHAFADLLPLVSVLFVNEVEAMALAGSSGEDAVRQLHQAGADKVILTRGANSTLAFDGGELLSTPSIKTKAIDSTGAGDTFLSTAVAYAIRRNGSVDRDALAAAARAAALTVTRPGTLSSFPSSSELEPILSD